MKALLDTSIIVEIDRNSKETIDLIKRLIDKDHDILVSVVSVSEILAGSYLRKDFKKALLEAKRILGQFIWIEMNAEIAEKTAQYLSYLIAEGKPIEYQDVVIAATFKATDSGYLVTLNKKHFQSIPEIKDMVFEPKELLKIMR